MRVIALLDPLAPLCWRGIAVWPDGIATALAFSHGRDETTSSRLEEIIVGEEVANWAGVRPERCDYLALRAEARLQHSWLRQQGEPSETARLVYLTNPLLPCDSPLVDRHWVARLPDLLPALEEAASRVDRAKMAPIDPALAAFIAARLERRIDHDLSSRTNSAGEAAVCLAQVRVLAQLQARQQARPLPALAAWLAARAGPLLVTWRNRQQRVALEQRLRSLTEAGYLPPMLQALEDPAGRSADALGANRAAQELEQINVELARIAEGAAARAAIAARLGLEVAAGFGLAALAAALVAAALG